MMQINPRYLRRTYGERENDFPLFRSLARSKKRSNALKILVWLEQKSEIPGTFPEFIEPRLLPFSASCWLLLLFCFTYEYN